MATDFRGRILTAPWIWLGGQFQHDVRLHIDGNGKIVQITKGHNEEMGDGCNDGTMNCHLNSLALLPGFVNAHSHAFHRRLRGRSRIGGLGADTFWKWREEMYALVRHIDFAQMKEICVDTFREMLAAGITTVGEFHYVHHENNDQQQQDDGGLFALDLAVVEAALEVGIRLVLIETLYMRSGFCASGLEADQWRFDAKSVDIFCKNVLKLKAIIACSDTVTLALLEEALQESVGITSEREKALAEQKKLCQKLSDQVTELFEAGSGAAVSQHQRQLRDALNALAETRSRLEEERLRSQRIVGTVRKELGMALVAEKEAAIALVHSCYGHDGIAPQPVRERLEQMHRQKERLRHALLTSTSGCGADGEKQQEELTRALGTAPPSAAVAAAAPAGHAGRQQQFSQPISIQTSGNICGSPHAQQQHPPPLGMSAPASLTYYGGGVNNSIPHQQLEDFGGGGIASLVDEEGIWA